MTTSTHKQSRWSCNTAWLLQKAETFNLPATYDISTTFEMGL